MTLACVVAARASSLAQVTASLGQNQPALDQITVNLGQTKLALDQSTVNVAQNKPTLEQDTATQLRVQPPAPFPSEISVPTVPPAPSPSSPPPSTTPGANPDQLYNTPRQRSEDLAAAEPEVVEQSLRAEGFPDTIGAPATAPPPAAVSIYGHKHYFAIIDIFRIYPYSDQKFSLTWRLLPGSIGCSLHSCAMLLQT